MSKPAPLWLAHVLDRDPQLHAWKARYERERIVTDSIRRQLPRPLAERMRVAETRAGALDLVAATGAIAAALRQRTPELLATLQREGHDFTEIRVRVQVGKGADPPAKVAPRQWDSGSAQPLFRLGDALSPGPLKASIARWSRRARGR